ncbi:MAG: valine--tRNA ligase [Chloroflexi bacterium]|nr:valine--tRNA ligase [Chloroflexota bacterium]
MADIETGAMPKTFNPRQVEQSLYQRWLQSGAFTPIIDWSQRPFTIVIPPPNITGELHYGHAMFVAFQDLMIRWHRMLGQPTLWLPGTDHAGIATQNVVEAELAREGLTRFDLGRERFVARVWQWKEKYGAIINRQLQRLGASVDWTRERFTLDEQLSRAVRVAFVRLFEKGLIYRGNYIVNWCPRCTTVLSDLEVDHEETNGKLYYIRYPLVPTDRAHTDPDAIVVATTRPETMLGDTAVAVNPADERYVGLIGCHVTLPFIGRVLPIIADTAVDPAFGTGAVKVTPAHDPNDYEIGRRHGLPAVNILNPNGTINAEGGPFAGLDRLEARKAVVQKLQEQGLLVRIEDHVHSVGHCSRCNDIIEPMISEQWFVKIKPLAEPAIQAVRDGRIRFIPERFARIYFNWMENIRDWPISRQLWWGHRIPVWYCDRCGQTIASVETPARCPSCGNQELRQDPDVLDTWFSSGLWPFSTLGWPEDTEDLRYFYPTSVLETGYDIIFFWVARMIMFGLEFTGKPPFEVVYLHGLLRDEHGEKMSKSKGNVRNPLEVIDRFGADALRYALVTGSTPGNDMRLSEEKLEGARNFANKLWNAARFVLSTGQPPTVEPDPAALTAADRWILSRYHRTVASVSSLLEEFEFGEAGRILYEFVWSEFCDWYIEIAKVQIRSGDAARASTTRWVLFRVLDGILRLLHPYMPFVTEAIWDHLPGRDSMLIVARWPSAGPTDPDAERTMDLVMEAIRVIRNARAEFRVEAGRRIHAVIVAEEHISQFESQRSIIEALARVEPLTIVPAISEPPRRALHLLARGIAIYLPLAEMVDLEAERRRAEQDLARLRAQIASLDHRLSEPGFTTKAPPEVVQRERERRAALAEQIEKIEERLAALA